MMHTGCPVNKYSITYEIIKSNTQKQQCYVKIKRILLLKRSVARFKLRESSLAPPRIATWCLVCIKPVEYECYFQKST